MHTFLNGGGLNPQHPLATPLGLRHLHQIWQSNRYQNCGIKFRDVVLGLETQISKSRYRSRAVQPSKPIDQSGFNVCKHSVNHHHHHHHNVVQAHAAAFQDHVTSQCDACFQR